jgi:hypothetical protein
MKEKIIPLGNLISSKARENPKKLSKQRPHCKQKQAIGLENPI